MRTYYNQFGLIALLLIVTAAPAFAQSERQTYQSLQHALFSAGNLTGDPGPQQITWIDGGERYSYLVQHPGTQHSEIRVYNPATGEEETIFNTAEHSFPGYETPFHFRSFQWSGDFRYLVFQTRFNPVYRYSGTADYYYYSLEEGKLRQLVSDTFTAELSPDGQSVGYHKNGDLFVFDPNTGRRTQLTDDAEDHFYNGRFGWVYEEEFGQVQAWRWSHDSRHIAFWQTDERHVPRFVSTNFEGTYPEYTDIPYPKVGEDNPHVKIGIADARTAELEWADLGTDGGLIPRIYWTSDPGTLAVVWMNRQQNHLKLFFTDISDGTSRLVMEEKSDDGWIDVFDFFSGADDYFFFPDDLDQFFWISDRDGYKHIYRYNYEGELINQVTRGDWQVTNIHAINTENERIYYESTEASPLERHLYSVQFDGSDPVRYSEPAGLHRFSMGENGRYYIDTWSNTTTPARTEIHSTENGGTKLATLTENLTVHDYIEQYEYSPRELFSFTTSQGYELDGYLVKPHDFDENEEYPLLLTIYGGPGSQGVTNKFDTNPWVQYLAQQGYVVANVNNRGSGGYGRDFEKYVYLNLGKHEARDFAETARYLADYDWIDRQRMAIRGHSYGGYMAALTMALHPRVFRVGLVAAPVTDWRLYDTIYTERYMGLLEDNEANYVDSSVMAHARHLQGNMLVVHSSMDENVHLQNTMQLITSLINTGKDIDLRIFPAGEHGVAYNQQSYLLLHQIYTNYLNRYLR